MAAIRHLLNSRKGINAFFLLFLILQIEPGYLIQIVIPLVL